MRFNGMSLYSKVFMTYKIELLVVCNFLIQNRVLCNCLLLHYSDSCFNSSVNMFDSAVCGIKFKQHNKSLKSSCHSHLTENKGVVQYRVSSWKYVLGYNWVISLNYVNTLWYCGFGEMWLVGKV